MNVEFRPAIMSYSSQEDILNRDGAKLGDVSGSVKSGGNTPEFHAALKAGPGCLFLLFQGHGETREAAIRDALLSGRRDILRAQEQLAYLERELGAE